MCAGWCAFSGRLHTPNKDNDLFYELGIRKGEDAREEQREEEKIAQLIKDLEAEKAKQAQVR